MHYNTYTELEESYAKEEIFPLDLKNAVARELSKVRCQSHIFCYVLFILQLLEPVYKRFLADPQMQLVRDKAYPDEGIL